MSETFQVTFNVKTLPYTVLPITMFVETVVRIVIKRQAFLTCAAKRCVAILRIFFLAPLPIASRKFIMNLKAKMSLQSGDCQDNSRWRRRRNGTSSGAPLTYDITHTFTNYKNVYIIELT